MGARQCAAPVLPWRGTGRPFPFTEWRRPKGSVLPPYSNADTLRRSSGTTSASNQGFFRSHAVFRQLG